MNKSKMRMLIGKSNGHFTNKYHRAQKLIDNWDYLLEKFSNMVERGNGRTKVSRMAYAILLMMNTGIRIGNEGSAEGYVSTNKYSEYHNKIVKTYGCTTLLLEHVTFTNKVIKLNFLGKKQVDIFTKSENPILITYGKQIKKRRTNNNQKTFLGITAYELTKFVKKYVGKKFQPKDFRTAKVNLMFIENIMDPLKSIPTKKSDVNKICKQTIINTAQFAGHTPSVCKSGYLSPKLFNTYKGTLIEEYLYKG